MASLARLVRASVLAIGLIQVACLPVSPRSQVIVARRGSHAGDVAKIQAICQAVAEQHGLASAPFPQNIMRITEYARPAWHDFTGPSIAVNTRATQTRRLSLL